MVQTVKMMDDKQLLMLEKCKGSYDIKNGNDEKNFREIDNIKRRNVIFFKI